MLQNDHRLRQIYAMARKLYPAASGIEWARAGTILHRANAGTR
jgi:hypothetical protein